jgi:TPP-dependent pyruvate/acetoin dehydrogenase alpha subunit/pyruvate/2-oxoglutarate/acetoin dehydrogenase E1 component
MVMILTTRSTPNMINGLSMLRTHKISTKISTRYLSSVLSSSSTWKPYENTYGSKIVSLPEYKAVEDLSNFLKTRKVDGSVSSSSSTILPTTQALYQHHLSPEDFLISLDASMATFLLHVNARIASMTGQGFYTIGPCGEELLSAAAMAIQPQDSTALHYRHTAMSLARQLRERISDDTSLGDVDKDVIIDELLLNRARGYAVSRYDPVTGGVHCSIGGSDNEFLVTSTLSSQCPPAVGRGLGYALRDDALFHNKNEGIDNHPPMKAVSFVTLGDGSLHNHHFLSSLTLARHAKHLNIKCPVVFGISDNGISISYETKHYVDSVFPSSQGSPRQQREDPLMPVFRANGQDMLDVYDQTQQAVGYARKYQSPCVILYKGLVRRFGHAATDRQDAYLDSETIQAAADTCVLEGAITQAVDVLNLTTYAELSDRFEDLRNRTDRAFGTAIKEPKVTLDDMMDRVSVPLAPVPPTTNLKADQEKEEKPQVMRKQMTRVVEEALDADESVVYLGEDVRHGGYYLVTEGLAKKYPKRVLDFPPDETTLLGAALGFSQLGLTPIVEIPYAKYLDCGADMFYEIAILPWLNPPTTSKDTKQPQQHSGMVIRLQGFDRGLFGGNFHTHNSLSHIPPGVDVVCYSNGEDYVRGFRHALWQAKHGRIVMLVDCTHLLNLRHVHDKDRSWERPYPGNQSDMIGFDQVYRYAAGTDNNKAFKQDIDSVTNARVAIISYGNGVVTSLQARRGLVSRGIVASENEVDVIDCPYISGVPLGLENVLGDYDHVLFADICKDGPGSNVFSSMITSLNDRGVLPQSWSFVGAPRTYNPLGSTVTFLNQDTIEDAMQKLLLRSDDHADPVSHRAV